jgi:Spy/CpxP family protein refolding chaperone
MIHRMLCMSVFAASLLAQGPGWRGSASPRTDALKTYLALTDAQVASLGQLRQQQAQAIKPLRQTLMEKQQALQTQTLAGGDAAALGQLLLDVQNLRKQISDTQTSLRSQTLGVLTTDQKTKLQSLQDAANLQPAIGGAMALNLLTPPQSLTAGQGPSGAAGSRFMRTRPARQN